MLTEFNIDVTMDDIDRAFSSRKVTKEMKEMWMKICEPVCKYGESLKNRSFEVNRCAVEAASPKADQEISGVMMAHWSNQLNLDLTIRDCTTHTAELSRAMFPENAEGMVFRGAR